MTERSNWTTAVKVQRTNPLILRLIYSQSIHLELTAVQTNQYKFDMTRRHSIIFKKELGEHVGLY